jgi:hypothetical protein
MAQLLKNLPILWNSTAHYGVHNIPPLFPILNQMNPVHTIESHFFMIDLNCIFPTYVWIFLLTFFLLSSHQKTRQISIRPSECYIPFPNCYPWIEHCNYIWRRLQVMKLFIMQFSPTYDLKSTTQQIGDSPRACCPTEYLLGCPSTTFVDGVRGHEMKEQLLMRGNRTLTVALHRSCNCQ